MYAQHNLKRGCRRRGYSFGRNSGRVHGISNEEIGQIHQQNCRGQGRGRKSKFSQGR